MRLKIFPWNIYIFPFVDINREIATEISSAQIYLYSIST